MAFDNITARDVMSVRDMYMRRLGPKWDAEIAMISPEGISENRLESLKEGRGMSDTMSLRREEGDGYKTGLTAKLLGSCVGAVRAFVDDMYNVYGLDLGYELDNSHDKRIFMQRILGDLHQAVDNRTGKVTAECDYSKIRVADCREVMRQYEIATNRQPQEQRPQQPQGQRPQQPQGQRPQQLGGFRFNPYTFADVDMSDSESQASIDLDKWDNSVSKPKKRVHISIDEDRENDNKTINGAKTNLQILPNQAKNHMYKTKIVLLDIIRKSGKKEILKEDCNSYNSALDGYLKDFESNVAKLDELGAYYVNRRLIFSVESELVKVLKNAKITDEEINIACEAHKAKKEASIPKPNNETGKQQSVPEIIEGVKKELAKLESKLTEHLDSCVKRCAKLGEFAISSVIHLGKDSKLAKLDVSFYNNTIEDFCSSFKSDIKELDKRLEDIQLESKDFVEIMDMKNAIKEMIDQVQIQDEDIEAANKMFENAHKEMLEIEK